MQPRPRAASPRWSACPSPSTASSAPPRALTAPASAIAIASRAIGTSDGARIVTNSPCPSPCRPSLHVVAGSPSVSDDGAPIPELPPTAASSRAERRVSRPAIRRMRRRDHPLRIFALLRRQPRDGRAAELHRLRVEHHRVEQRPRLPADRQILPHVADHRDLRRLVPLLERERRPRVLPLFAVRPPPSRPTTRPPAPRPATIASHATPSRASATARARAARSSLRRSRRAPRSPSPRRRSRPAPARWPRRRAWILHRTARPSPPRRPARRAPRARLTPARRRATRWSPSARAPPAKTPTKPRRPARPAFDALAVSLPYPLPPHVTRNADATKGPRLRDRPGHAPRRAPPSRDPAATRRRPPPSFPPGDLGRRSARAHAPAAAQRARARGPGPSRGSPSATTAPPAPAADHKVCCASPSTPRLERAAVRIMDSATTCPKPRWSWSTSPPATCSPTREPPRARAAPRSLRRSDRAGGQRVQDRHRRRARRSRLASAPTRASATPAASRKSSPATSKTTPRATGGAPRSPAPWATVRTPSSRSSPFAISSTSSSTRWPSALRLPGEPIPLRRPRRSQHRSSSPATTLASRAPRPASGTRRALAAPEAALLSATVARGGDVPRLSIVSEMIDDKGAVVWSAPPPSSSHRAIAREDGPSRDAHDGRSP